ncbi:MAG: ADP-ribosylation factor-directed GTPase activating protein isoform b [Planctomycetia bacterium]|nr:ADP-ribosylation factor-directed GTPase activating protein isoform b [Planctomycetia bacterium]
MRVFHKWWLLGVVVLAGLTSSSCGPSATTGPLPSDDQLRAMLDEELNYTYTRRSLNLADNGAWQIMHAVLPFGTHFKVYNGDQPVAAVQWVLDGNRMKGWTLQHGTENLGGRRGLKTLVEPGKIGQGHPEQWLSILAASGIPSTQKIVYDGRDYQVADLLRQGLWDTYKGKEASWTLMSTLVYLGPDAKWQSSDGTDWTVEKLVAMEADQDLGNSACGGTHRLTALNKAVKARKLKGGDITGGWKTADDKVREAIETAHRFQQPDGSLSNNFFVRPGASSDPVAQMYSTGHTLEFIVQAIPDSELDAPWVKRAVVKLCDLFHKTRNIDMECGSLYHATNGLKKYRERKFGVWPYPDESTVVPPVAVPGGDHAVNEADRTNALLRIARALERHSKIPKLEELKEKDDREAVLVLNLAWLTVVEPKSKKFKSGTMTTEEVNELSTWMEKSLDDAEAKLAKNPAVAQPDRQDAPGHLTERGK